MDGSSRYLLKIVPKNLHIKKCCYTLMTSTMRLPYAYHKTVFITGNVLLCVKKYTIFWYTPDKSLIFCSYFCRILTESCSLFNDYVSTADVIQHRMIWKDNFEWCGGRESQRQGSRYCHIICLNTQKELRKFQVTKPGTLYEIQTTHPCLLTS